MIEQIKKDILDDSKKLATILRKAKVLASTLLNKELSTWVDNELRGYLNTNDKIPDYRKMNAENYGSFSGPFGSGLNNFPIPITILPDYAQKFAENCVFKEGVSEYESLLDGDSKVFHINWPPDLIALVQHDVTIYQNMSLYHAYQQISRGTVVGMLDMIRNNLLDFILDLEKNYPELIKSDEGMKKIPNEKVTSIFQTHIYGGTNVITSGENINQNIQLNVIPNDIESLKKYISSIGVPVSEVSELETAIKKDGKPTEKKVGKNVAKWLGETLKKIAMGTINLAIEKIPALIIKALNQYYNFNI